MPFRIERRYKDERVSAALSSFERDADVIYDSWNELVDRYPDEWISTHDGEIFHAETLNELFRMLRARGIEPGSVPREFLAKNRPPILL